MNINTMPTEINNQDHGQHVVSTFKVLMQNICGKRGTNPLPPRRQILKVEACKLNLLFNIYTVILIDKKVYKLATF